MMMMMMMMWLFVCLAAVSADPDKELYIKVGDTVVLTPGSSAPELITSILWKMGVHLAAEWDGNEVETFHQFRERSSLDISAGTLTITGLTRNDSGSYTVAINQHVVSQTHLRVISPVPKPTVSSLCYAESSVCLMTCHHGDTRDAQPVTYIWINAVGKVIQDRTAEYNITKGEFTEISCALKNPVSYEESNSLRFNDGIKLKLGLVVLISLLAGLAIVTFIHRWKAGVWFYDTAFMPWEAGFWTRQRETARVEEEVNGERVDAAQSNGAGAATVAVQPEHTEENALIGSVTDVTS